MIINSSYVNMESDRKSRKTSLTSVEESRSLVSSSISSGKSLMNNTGSNNSNKKLSDVKTDINDELTISDQAKQMLEKMKEEQQQRLEELEKSSNISSPLSSTQKTAESEENPLIQKLKTIIRLLEMLTGRKMNISGLLDENGVNKSAQNQDLNTITNSWDTKKTVTYFNSESENTVFSTTGLAVTADGRQISFDVELEMSREFQEYFQVSESYVETMTMVDPLVINLDGGHANVTDQKFLFDIDSDGTKDEIGRLSEGSGFLAYDRNNDGKINNGGELFGTKTGDGFGELAQYDKDSNGWIDEADDIFSKLKIWSTDEDGNDILISLKNAGVGAIYLGSASTEFSLTDNSNNVNAQIRKTGIYLNENGSAGTIQHVDFAVRPDEDE